MGQIEAVFRSLGAGVMVFRPDGKLESISPALLDRLGYDRSSAAAALTPDAVFEGEAYRDIFEENGGRIRRGRFQNYRAYLRTYKGDILLFQIGGYCDEAGRLCFFVQELDLPQDLLIDTGPFVENVRAFQVMRRYVSPQVMGGIRQAIRMGRETIPDEDRVLTYLFADMVAFTALAERIGSKEIVELLNLSIGANSSTVLHWGGYIDKIMGDSIFAVFEEPLNAIIAAVEIQKQFNILNFFRLKEGQDSVELRVGLHTGPCTIASIGTLEFMELTYIGDAVNTASRIESAALPGTILASSVTVAMVRDHLTLGDEVELKVKGKTELLHAHYVKRVTFDRGNGKQISIGTDDDIFA